MRMRIAATAASIALYLVAPALAQAPSEAPQTITGAVISSSDTSLVIRSDDGAAKTYVIEESSTLPVTPLAAGNRVTILYRPFGESRFAVVSVALSESAPAGAAESGQDEMPATAGVVPLLGLVGVGLLAGGVALRAFARS